MNSYLGLTLLFSMSSFRGLWVKSKQEEMEPLIHLILAFKSRQVELHFF